MFRDVEKNGENKHDELDRQISTDSLSINTISSSSSVQEPPQMSLSLPNIVFNNNYCPTDKEQTLVKPYNLRPRN